MALRDVLVHVDDSKSCVARIAASVQLAEKHDAHLVGLYIVPNSAIPGYVDVQVPVDLIKMQEDRLLEAAKLAEQAFIETTKQAGISSEWRCQKGDAASVLADHGHYTDLIVIGQRDRELNSIGSSSEMMDEIILTAGRPVLIIPHNFKGSDIGTKVIVGWDQGQRATRALHDAIPLLQKADEVSIMTVNPGSEPKDREHLPSVDIAHHLARHHIQVSADHVTSNELSVGDHLLSRAADMGADLLVTGAYGHARWRELILGGVTRKLLENMPIPILMSN